MLAVAIAIAAAAELLLCLNGLCWSFFVRAVFPLVCSSSVHTGPVASRPHVPRQRVGAALHSCGGRSPFGVTGGRSRRPKFIRADGAGAGDVCCRSAYHLAEFTRVPAGIRSHLFHPQTHVCRWGSLSTVHDPRVSQRISNRGPHRATCLHR